MHLASKTFALVALLAAAACGNSSVTTTTGSGGASGSSGSTGGAGGASGPTAEEACTAAAKTACDKRDLCSGGFLNKRIFGDATTCASRTAAVCVANLGSKGDAQTPAKIAACTHVYSSYACPDFFDDNPPAPCVPPQGDGTPGAACGVSGQCASKFCAIPENEVCGVCQPLPVAGATCQVQADCGRDLACAKTAIAPTGKCAAWVAAGGACLTGVSPCQAGLGCVGDDVAAMKMGTCQADATTVGAACDRSRKTMPTCDVDLGLACIPAMKGSAVGTCQAIQLAAPGAPCGDLGAMPITGVAACQAGGLCKTATALDTTGICVAPAVDGAPCDADPTKGPPCLSPSKCVPTAPPGTAGTCTSPDAHKCM